MALNQLNSIKTMSKQKFKPCILLLSDGQFSVDASLLSKIRENGIVVNTVGLGSGVDTVRLKEISDETGGEFFYATTASELDKYFKIISSGSIFDLNNMKDTDKDGLPDDFEKFGMPISNGRIVYTDPNNPDTDGDGLKDGEEILSHPKTKIKPGYYYAVPELESDGIEFWMISDPNKKEKEDIYSLINKVRQLEKYIDEYKRNKITITDTSVIAMNLIRALNYGSHNIIDFTEWTFTCGEDFFNIREYVESHDPTLMSYFKQNNNKILDLNGDKMDYIHTMATLSAYWFDNPILNTDLAGWAGDLQTLLKDVRNKKNNDKKYKDKNLKEIAYSIIATSDSKYFPLEDMLGDVDAKNIYMLYKNKRNMKLADMLKDYYSKKYKKRYSLFIENSYGIKSLENSAKECVYKEGLHPIKYLFLSSNIIKEESEALVYAFIRYIEEHFEK